jgi:trans-aconitate 2-methyltransferase
MYKWNPEEYQDNSDNQQKWGVDLIANLKLTGNERILDIGCGVGNITAAIAEKLPKGSVIGIDSSLDMVRQSEKSYPANKHPNLSFIVKDASMLDFINEFDIVFSNACLHWIKNHLPVLRGIQRSLHSGGRIMLQMGGRDNAKHILEVIGVLIKQPQWSSYFTNFDFPYGFYGPEDYEGWLAETGLIKKRLELVPKDMTHDNKNKFAAWIRTTWLPYTQEVPASLREQFINELVTEYVKLYPADCNGYIHVQMNRLEVEAYKP